MKREKLLSDLENYSTPFADEEEMRLRMMGFIREHEDCLERSLAVGHITGSAWIVSPERNEVLLIHHLKLDRWLQPGGHADGESDISNVAFREAVEETCLKSIRLISDTVFDVDIHLIPENPKDMAHFHYDLRYLFEADPKEIPTITKETKGARWMKIADLPGLGFERSILRMAGKTVANPGR